MIKVLKAGFYSTIQDQGRFGFQDFGVPISGVMDAYSAKLANLLLGNNENAAVLEITMTGPLLQFLSKTLISISGANMLPALNDSPLRMNSVIEINPNDLLSFGRLNEGFRCYLAISGGFQTDEVMNSRSMFKNITMQTSIQTNDVLKSVDPSPFEGGRNASIKLNTHHFTSNFIDVYPGPEFDMLSDQLKTKILNTEFTIAKENNRMAYQLKETIPNDLEPIITSLVIPGTVQLTPSGKLIILMRDCQTTGGYPRVFQLKTSSINTLSQKCTGNTIRFRLL